jgi:hypothetical protein
MRNEIGRKLIRGEGCGDYREAWLCPGRDLG